MRLLDAPARPPSALGPGVRRILFWGTALAVIALDQLTKTIVRSALERGESWPDPDWFARIRYVTNSGAAFGILQDQTAFLIVTSLIGLAAIYLYYRYPPFEHHVVPIAIGMMLGGALGNMIDRVRVGEVTDFVDVGSFPAFNVADSSISIGIAVVLVGYLLLWPGPDDKPREDDPTHV
jgi:signal peptidase II